MAQRILILSAAVGAGHLRAAQAMELAFKAAAPDAEVHNVDVLTLTNALFRRLYGAAYLDLATKAPHLLGAVYDWTDHPQKTRGKSHKLREIVQKVNLNKVIKLLDEPWDVVVNTHFLPADIIARRRRQKKLATRQVTVVTDFDAHAFWVNEPSDWYYVATEEAALSLAHWGVDRAKMSVTGIPIHPMFAARKDRSASRSKHGLSADRPVVLMLAGGFGVGPIEEMHHALLAMGLPVHIAAVCGRNAELKKRLDKIKPPAHQQVTVIGFTTEIDELMAAADLVVTKPGGLTTSEVLALGAAMAIMNPIPGQEDRNSDYLLEHGAAIKINSLASLGWKVSQLLGDRPRLERLRANAAALGHPNAAGVIAADVLKSVPGGRTR